MEKDSDSAIFAASSLLLFAVILFLAGWWTDKFSTLSGQVIAIIGIFFGSWGLLTLKNPDKFGGIAINIFKGLLNVGENATRPNQSKKTDTTINIGTVHGDLNQNVNSKKGKIITGKNTPVTVIDGEHSAKGNGEVTGIDIDEEPVLFKPGTKSTAEGKGSITATRIGKKRQTKK